MASAEFLSEFDSLSAKRQRFLDSIQENNLEGLLTQLTEIYPDEAHFIFELLQNAEDAEASEVSFFLTGSSLAFRHNGVKQFSIKDIEAITNYGNSTKKVESNKIGKFGVGFKSVFAYTSKPIINSDGFTFSITHTTLPSREVIDPGIEATFQEGITTFIFNFDEPSKPKLKAYQEIKHGLKDLDERALLFLSNVKRINIRYPQEPSLNRMIEKNELGQDRVGFLIKESESETTSFFLVLRDRMPALSSEALDESVADRVSKLSIGLAFELKRNEEDNFEIVPIENANVCVYFPAIKEDSGLKFHIHAPFASTPSRDVIRMTAENRAIIDGISKTLRASLSRLKKTGYLGEGLLSALPNSVDRINSMYEVFRTDLVEAFQGDEELLPLGGNQFVNYRVAIVANAQIQNAVGHFLLAELFKFSDGVPNGGYKYLPMYKNSRAQQFITSIRPNSLTITDIRNLLRTFMGTSRLDSLQKALNALSPEQLRNFFLLFYSVNPDTLKEIRDLPFVPLNSPSQDFGKPSESYLPSKSFKDGENMVSSILLDPEKPNPEIYRSLQNLGLKVLDDWTMLDLNIAKLATLHKSGEAVSELDLDLATKNLQDYSKSVGGDPERLRKLASLNIFIGLNSDDNPVWTSLDEVFVDLPIRATGLDSVRGHLLKKYKLWDGYSRTPLIDLFIANSKALVKVVPEKIVHANGSFDWKINSFEEMLETGDDVFLLAIWELLIDQKNDQLRWEVKAEKSFSSFTYLDSSFIAALTYSAWLPCKDGKKRRPTKVNREILDSRFRFLDSKYVQLIKFDASSQEAAMRQRAEARAREEKNELAKELGFKDLSEVEALQKIQKLQPEIIKNLISSMENHFPEETVEDFEESLLTATKSIGNSDEVKIVENVIRERKNYKTNHAVLKDYLRRAYSLGRQMKCQACGLFMPFQLLSGEDYFEAVYFIKSLSREIKHNGLALCPVCAAKYKYTLRTTPDELIHAVKGVEVLGTGSVSLQIIMGMNDYDLTFTDEHIVALKGIFKS
jgi:hypothetical protein